MGLVSWIVVGLVTGLLARWIVPSAAPDGFVVTVLLGMSGASVGGFVAGVLGGSWVTGLNVWSVFVATLGAVILLSLYGLVARRTARESLTHPALDADGYRRDGRRIR
jgi:uncharacterized membrane protein YeaQ/YmgE (transglycosylase-associated protein family)